MTPGHIDLKIVADRLALVAGCLTDLRALPQSSLDEFLADRRNAFAAEALLRRALEALFDTARHMLAAAYGIGALEYRQVADLAAEKGLVTDEELSERFRLMAGYRNRLTHHYEDVTPQELYGIVASELGDLDSMADALRLAASRLASPEDKG
jgi:uncharacterized protein YutE (UPF0331/DUF86 family)